jgi:hypothetical protein
MSDAPDTRERFLRDIAASVPADRIAELHLFRPIRRGPTETGVAVIAASQSADTIGPADPADRPPALGQDSGADLDDSPSITADAAPPADAERHTVFTARYRLTLKGAERGKWEFDVVADADAPLGEVDTVVRGVQRRSGDEDEPERLDGPAVRAAVGLNR